MKWLILLILTGLAVVAYVRYSGSSKELKPGPTANETANPGVETQPNLAPTLEKPLDPNEKAAPSVPPQAPPSNNSGALPPVETTPPSTIPQFNNGFQNNPPEFNQTEPPPPPQQFFPDNENFNSVPSIEPPSPFEPPSGPNGEDFNNGFVPPPPPPPPIDDGE
jgi:hypothetical protein